MTILTVDDLARDLKVRNEDLVKELVSMGFTVDGPESSLETDDPAALKAELVSALPQREVVEKRIGATVIRRRVKKAPEAAPKETASAESQTEVPEASKEARPPERSEAPKPAGEPRFVPRKPVDRSRRHEPARIIEKAPSLAVKKSPPSIAAAAGQTEAVAETPKPATEAPSDTVAVQGPVSFGEPRPEVRPIPAPETELESVSAGEISEPAVSAEADENRTDDHTGGDDKGAKKKKKKERRVQPAQIIGRVELKKEPPREIRPEPAPSGPRHQTPRPSAPRPVGPRPQGDRPERKVFTVTPVIAVDPAEEERRRKRKKEKKPDHIDEKKVDDEKGLIKRRKEVLLRDDLYDDWQRHGRRGGKPKKPVPKKTQITVPKASKRRLKIPDLVTVADLAHKMSVKASQVMQHLMALGVSATMNEPVDLETATLVASEFGFDVESAEHSEQDFLPDLIQDTAENLKTRPPVVTVMGHVDHGKTSLLDYIRSTRVTAQESGGITQHIGASKVSVPKGDIIFLDTPGHEAFTAMRARGAQVTDFVVLVVAADDGVKEQTREAINHARAAKAPIVVAVNKMDKPEADKDRVIRELSEYGLIPEAWGGDTLFTFVSAKTGQGMDEFLDTILLQAEVMELKANPDKTASGAIVEARLDKGKGPVATVLIKEGTLRLGNAFVAGLHFGRVRAMLDHEGKPLSEAGPAEPVEVQGFSGVPDAGDSFLVVEDEKVARQVTLHRAQKLREKEAGVPAPLSLEDILARIQGQEAKELNLIVKADVQGSVEAVKEALLGASNEEVRVKVIHDGVGTITESDVMLAGASGAMIIGFNVRPAPKITQLAEERKIQIRLYTIIYEAIEDIRMAARDMLAPVTKETVVGRAEVRQTFNVPKIGTVAGCHVISGKVQRSNNVRLLRDDVVIFEGKIASLRRFKDDVKEALEGYECGIGLDNYRDVKVGDVIEAYIVEQEAPKIS
jgi:translation initiation factor IF-2